ncbi:MAG: 1,4-dihydroxy-2-naphthoate octaprenyltransferase [Candidatus Krumholzibacteria bacterium]|nr:1,4-dihydroxy-2-naphthoate octaprenyltransferase [Candidatus Krumholzibacteria bacterium]
MRTVTLYLRELRARFLTVSVLPVILAVAVARHETGRWDPLLAVLTLAGAALLHLGANTINDWFDHRSGNDVINVDFASPFTGGSRLIQEGLISPRGVLALSLSLMAAACAVGAALTVMRGPLILLFGAVGMLLGILYTEPRAILAGRGLGELAILAAFGLIAVGAYWVQTGTVTAQGIVAPLPLALLTTAIIIINEFQDMRADGATGKRTLVVRLGGAKGAVLFAAVMLGSYLPTVAGVAAGIMPRWTLLGLASLPLAARAIAVAASSYDDPRRMAPANAATILCHLATGIALTAVYLIV